MGIVLRQTSALGCSKYLQLRQHSVVMSSKLNFTTGTLKRVVGCTSGSVGRQKVYQSSVKGSKKRRRTTSYVVASRGEVHFTSEGILQECCQVRSREKKWYARRSFLFRHGVNNGVNNGRKIRKNACHQHEHTVQANDKKQAIVLMVF